MVVTSFALQNSMRLRSHRLSFPNGVTVVTSIGDPGPMPPLIFPVFYYCIFSQPAPGLTWVQLAYPHRLDQLVALFFQGFAHLP